MADHFYSQAPGKIGDRTVSAVTIGTATAAGSKIELRIEDGAIPRHEAYLLCKRLADFFSSASAKDVLPAGQFTG